MAETEVGDMKKKRPTSGPSKIYLDPDPGSYDRLWCEDDCPEGNEPWIEYVRGDLVLKQKKETGP